MQLFIILINSTPQNFLQGKIIAFIMLNRQTMRRICNMRITIVNSHQVSQASAKQTYISMLSTLIIPIVERKKELKGKDIVMQRNMLQKRSQVLQ